MAFSSEEDDLYDAALQILEARKSSSKTVHCYGCDEEMRPGKLLICSECLSEECDLFVKNSLESLKKD